MVKHATAEGAQTSSRRPETAAEPPAPKPAPVDWSDDFTLAPHNAKVLVTPDGEKSVEAQWRPTRAYDAEANGWVASGYWADPIMLRRLPFEPLGWMPAPAQPKAPVSLA